MRTILILLCLALAGSLYFALDQYWKVQRWVGVKYEYEFDLPRNITITRLKENGRLLDVGYDRNGDLENDSLVLYAANGKASSIWTDEDHNGIYEVQYLFDPEDRLVARYEDIGQDGYFNEYTRYSPDSVFVYRDLNGDNWYEEDELLRKSAQ